MDECGGFFCCMHDDRCEHGIPVSPAFECMSSRAIVTVITVKAQSSDSRGVFTTLNVGAVGPVVLGRAYAFMLQN